MDFVEVLVLALAGFALWRCRYCGKGAKGRRNFDCVYEFGVSCVSDEALITKLTASEDAMERESVKRGAIFARRGSVVRWN